MLNVLRARPLPGPALGRRAPAFWPAFVVFALGCCAYVGAAGTYFLKDDLAMSLLTDARGIPDFAALVRNFLWPVSMTHDQFYRPLPVLFGWFDLNLFGADPAAFRICNIGFHGLNGVLLALFVNQLTRFRRPTAGWFAGILFALHPLHGEAVLWVTQRMVVMCATFSLLSLIALEAWFRSASKTGLAVCITSALAAALCKEVTVALAGPMILIALTHPSATGRARIRRTLVTAACGAALSAGMLVVRWAIFGVWVGTYGNMTLAEYGKHFRIFERLPRSLLDGLLAVNSLEVPERARFAFGAAWIVFLVIAVWRLVLAMVAAPILRAALILAAFAATSFLPTLGIFYIEPMLTNGRFLYQPLLGVVGLLMLGFTIEARRRPLLALAAPAALAVLFALAGQLNLRAYAGADSQIRTIREGIIRQADQVAGDPVVIVYGVPTEFHGVVTLDRSLEFAMRPPFLPPPGLDVFPFVGGEEGQWPVSLKHLRSWLETRPGRRMIHLICDDNPIRVSPLVGALAPSRGADPPEVLAPGDGAVLVHPDEDPTFVFQPAAGAAGYRLRLATDLQKMREIEIDLDPSRNLRRVSTRLQYQFRLGGQRTRITNDKREVTEGPDPWAIWSGGGFAPPFPVTWSLEALDAAGHSLGRSAERAMVLVTSRVGQ